MNEHDDEFSWEDIDMEQLLVGDIEGMLLQEDEASAVTGFAAHLAAAYVIGAISTLVSVTVGALLAKWVFG